MAANADDRTATPECQQACVATFPTPTAIHTRVMPAFEPSTWAEVEEAAASGKPSARVTNALATRVWAFTDAPERAIAPEGCLRPAVREASSLAATRTKSWPKPFAALKPESKASDDEPTPLPNAHLNLPRPPLSRSKRNPLQFEDLLGLGRVDIDAQALVRRYTQPSTSSASVATERTAFPPLPVAPSPVNPSCADFDPEHYISRVHRATPLEDLRKGLGNLSDVAAALDARADAMRAETYSSIALSAATFENTRHFMHQYSPFVKRTTSPAVTDQKFAEAEAVLITKYQGVLERERQVERLQNVLSVVKRFQWLFVLGSRLRTAAGEGILSIEDAIREYLRGCQWLEVQDGTVPGMQRIEKDIKQGFEVLIEAISARLSTGIASRSDISRMVAVLTTVRREHIVDDALTRRMQFALDGLEKESRVFAVSNALSVGGRSESDAAELASRTSMAFVEGLSHFWQLARVVAGGQERWMQLVDNLLQEIVHEYADGVRASLMGDVHLITREAVLHVVNARTRALMETGVPRSHLGPVTEVTFAVTDAFVTSIARAMKNSAEHVALSCVQAGTVRTHAARLVCAVAMEAVAQVEDIVLAPADSTSSLGSSQVSAGVGGVYGSSSSVESSAHMLTMACIRSPAVLASELGELLSQGQDSIQLAVACSDLLDDVVDRVCARVRSAIGCDDSFIAELEIETVTLIQGTREQAVRRYVELVSPRLVQTAKQVGTFPGDKHCDGSERPVGMTVNGISACARELALELVLMAVKAQRNGAGAETLSSMLAQIIENTGFALKAAMVSAEHVAAHHAAQVWVDASYLSALLKDAAPGSREGFAKAREHAARAVMAAGYPFGAAETESLSETVVNPGVRRAYLVRQALAEVKEAPR